MIEDVVSVVEDQETPVTPARTAGVPVVVDGEKDRGVRGEIQRLQDDR